MNPSTAFAQVVVDEMVRGGVEHAVLAPGSRSAPLALAFAAAERAGRLRLYVRTDERSAGFLALGLAKGSGTPVPILTTSGTAAAHLHAAVLEASYSGVPLIALTADRPPELRGIAANQTIDQIRLYGEAVRFFADVDVPERSKGSNEHWRALVCRALIAARGITEDRRPGAVHLNLPLRAPLLPGLPESGDGSAAEQAWPESLDGREDGRSWVAARSRLVGRPDAPSYGDGRSDSDSDVDVDSDADADADVDAEEPTWLVLGDAAAEISEAAVALARRRGWPILAEPTGNAGAAAVPAYLGLLESEAFLERHLPQRVVCVGRPTLSRAVQHLLDHERVRVERYALGPQWTGLSDSIEELRDRELARFGPDTADPATALIELLAAAGEELSEHQDRILDEGYLGGAKVARDLVSRLPDGSRLFIGSSTPIRDVDRYAHPRDGIRMVANRGVAGIDGSVSTPVGLALSEPDRSTFALIGDLTFLHDLGGLVIPAAEPKPDLTFVVVDNRGGGIFAQLEPGRPEYERDYDRVFGTPHQLDLVEVARSLGWEAEEVTKTEQLGAALSRGGPRVVVVRTDQRKDAELLRRVREGPDGTTA